jgi:hypothetical protein
VETRNKGTAIYEDEINLYDCWKVIVKRKSLIIGLFLVATIASAIISLSMPRIYRGEVILKLPAIATKELLGIIGKLDAGKIKNILPKTHHLITGVKLDTGTESTDKLQLIIEAKNRDDISSAITEFIVYLNNFSLINRSIEEERQRLIKQTEELSIVIKEADELAQTFKKLLNEGKLIPFGFNPVEVKKKSSDMRVERFAIEQALKRPMGVEMLENPYILKNPVKPSIKKNIAIAGITSLFAGIFLAFLMGIYRRDKE